MHKLGVISIINGKLWPIKSEKLPRENVQSEKRAQNRTLSNECIFRRQIEEKHPTRDHVQKGPKMMSVISYFSLSCLLLFLQAILSWNFPVQLAEREPVLPFPLGVHIYNNLLSCCHLYSLISAQYTPVCFTPSAVPPGCLTQHFSHYSDKDKITVAALNSALITLKQERRLNTILTLTILKGL